ncbi:MAG: signal peptidase I [Spirochaetales bacterium]|nr:signal peptidase I [Spirochaetales bacterium]
MQLAEVETFLITHTERYLTWRKRRKLKRKAKQKQKNQILDWIQALLWAAVVVLILNQYLIQAYAVPSGSMEDTIIGDDRLFVDKIVYGPELVPGFGKLPGFELAKRGDIVVFLNPDYETEMGRDVTWVEELFNRLVYMLTFTIVNLDKDAKGNIAKHFLVKRLIAQPGERFRMRDGRVEIMQGDGNGWTSEDDLKKQYTPLDYQIQKKFYPFDQYPVIRENVIQQTYLKGGVAPETLKPGIDARYVYLFCYPRIREADRKLLSPDKPEEFESIMIQYVLAAITAYNPEKDNWTFDKIRTEYYKAMIKWKVKNEPFGNRHIDLSGMSDEEIALQYKKTILEYNLLPRARIDAMSKDEVEKAYQAAAVKYIYIFQDTNEQSLYTDRDFEDYWLNYAEWGLKPYDEAARNRFEHRALGLYISPDRFFPMGDNRDNSRDARFFGEVKTSNLLGKSLFRFWPLNRLGPVY